MRMTRIFAHLRSDLDATIRAAIAAGKQNVIAGVSALVGSLGITPTLIVAGPLLALVFPDGRLPGRSWKWPAGLIAAAVAVSSAILALRPGPVAVKPTSVRLRIPEARS